MIAPLIVAAGISALGSLLGGGGGSTTSTKNVNNPLLTSSLSGSLGAVNTASSSLTNLLGLGDDPTAQQKGFEDFRNSTGYQFGLDQGSQAITGNKAAGGLLNSGSTLKALNQYGQDYASTKYDDYLNNLFNLGQLGLGAGGILATSGQTSKTKSGGKK